MRVSLLRFSFRGYSIFSTTLPSSWTSSLHRIGLEKSASFHQTGPMACRTSSRVALLLGLNGLILMTLPACQTPRQPLDAVWRRQGASELLTEAQLSYSHPGLSSIQVVGGFRAGEIELPTSEALPLANCVAQAGGLCWWADPSRVLVIRPRGEGRVCYQLHMRHIASLPPKCLMLQPGDQLMAQAYPLFGSIQSLRLFLSHLTVSLRESFRSHELTP